MKSAKMFVIACLCALVAMPAIRAANRQAPPTGLPYQAPTLDRLHQPFQKDPGVSPQSGTPNSTIVELDFCAE